MLFPILAPGISEMNNAIAEERSIDEQFAAANNSVTKTLGAWVRNPTSPGIMTDSGTGNPEAVDEFLSKYSSKYRNDVEGQKQALKDYMDDNGLPYNTNDPPKTEETLWYQPLLDAFSKLQSSTDAANELAQKNATSAQNFEAEQARLAREFVRESEDTYFQRRVKDLKAAGLNPWLALFGGGNTSATGSYASGKVAETFKSSEKLSDYAVLIPVLVTVADTLIKSITSAFKK